MKILSELSFLLPVNSQSFPHLPKRPNLKKTPDFQEYKISMLISVNLRFSKFQVTVKVEVKFFNYLFTKKKKFKISFTEKKINLGTL